MTHDNRVPNEAKEYSHCFDIAADLLHCSVKVTLKNIKSNIGNKPSMPPPREAIMRNFWHRLVGSRGGVASGFAGFAAGHDVPLGPKTTKNKSNYGNVYTSPSHEIARHRLVFLGEIHSVPSIIAFQRQVQEEMNKQSNNQLHLILEHFSFDLQHLLDQFSSGDIDFDQLVEKYHDIGQEGHDLEPYRGLLEDARLNNVRLYAGFLPRTYARKFIKDDPNEVLQDASKWMKSPIIGLEGSEFHYNIFESLISGRSIYRQHEEEGGSNPNPQFRKIFKAQVLKDAAMANKVNEIINDNKGDEKVLVIAGNGHFLHFCGIPERVLSENPSIVDDSCLVISASLDETLESNNDLNDSLKLKFGEEGTNPADYILFYHRPEEDNSTDEMVDAKEETRKAYDKVGESAALPGNKLKAAWIMHNLGYTEDQFKAAGPDVYNFQGVGNPHMHANIQSGEHVLDVGSGLGIDSFIASHSTGSNGKVTGIDISSKEVKHAQQQAKDQGLENIHFLVADMEKIPLPDGSVDVVISNGAFCLAPDKKRAFQELFRVLKPGGRISVCTTTTKVENLEQGVSWPLCMQMFIAQKELRPMCEAIGFHNVFVDDSDSAMSMEIPEEVLQDSNPNRNKVHVGGEDFKHLENYDMDKICARVCVHAFKPL